MQWTETKRRLSILAAGAALLLAAACGGGDKSPTGPGGGGVAGAYDAALGAGCTALPPVRPTGAPAAPA